MPDGVTIALPDNLSVISTYVLLEQHDWFEDEIRFLRALIKPGMRALDVGADHVFPLAGLVVGLGPRQFEHVGEEPFGDAVPAYDTFGELVTLVGKGDPLAADVHETLGLHALDHLGDRRSGDPEALDQAGLDDLNVVLAQLEDALAIFLERRVMFAGRGHALKDTY